MNMDRFHQRLSSVINPGSLITDTQLITLGSGSAGWDMTMAKNLRETLIGATPSITPPRINIYGLERKLTIHGLAAPGDQFVEIIKWRPRYDNSETATQTFAHASAHTGETNYTGSGVIGTTLFDSRIWCTAYKAVKTYRRQLRIGKAWVLKFKRKFKKPLLVDYVGEWYYTLSGGNFTDSHFMVKRRTSEIFTYRLVGATPIGNTTTSEVGLVAPGAWIQDEMTVHYMLGQLNTAKSSYESAYSNAPKSISGSNSRAINNGYQGIQQPFSIVTGLI